MSRNHRRREEPPQSSHWEPGYRRSYTEYSQRRYGPPTEHFPRNSPSYWRDGVAAATSYYPQRSYGRESYNEWWRDDSRSRHAESSCSRGRFDSGPGRGRNDLESYPDGSPRPPHQNPSSRPRHSTYAPPYTPRLTTCATSPTESITPFPNHAPSEPPRKTSPPRKMSSQPLLPSPRYLSLSQGPSEVLDDSTKTRKLLVLDLNGTLLIRSARPRTTSGPQLRPVQPRPYMQSFRQYLFCLETRAWLDTMVWSSAQPHSVDDMVEKVFGTGRGELKAVWNRKSLGLSEADYHRKTVTTKDLTKAWDLFASALSPEKLHVHSSVPSQSQIMHSALTTLLLDDSPHKAVLQPYNHVCIPEYDGARRQHDLRSFLATKEPKQNKKAKRRSQVETSALPTDQIIPELHPIGALMEEPYDVTLLAVIGILETVKLQSNVAAWIRKGGLWATQERVEEGGKTVPSKIVRSGNDASSTSDPTVTPEQAQAETEMWFEDSSVVSFWVERGRRSLMELGIQVVHGVTG